MSFFQFSNKFQIVIDKILKVRPEERPNTTEILEIPEIIDKIEELNIFKKNKDLANKNFKNLCNTTINLSKKIKFNRNISEPIIESASVDNNPLIEGLMITKLKYHKKEKDHNKLNINKSCEIRNKRNINFKISNQNLKKQEIFNIYKYNLEYFKQK